MAGEFIPFLSAAKAPLAGSGAPQFRPVAPASPVASSGNTAFFAKQALAKNPSHSHGEVAIEMKRDGDRVSQIRIQCRCGEVIELDCEY